MKTPSLPQLPSINLKDLKIKFNRTAIIVTAVLVFILLVTAVGAVQSVKRAQAISASNTAREERTAQLEAKVAKLEKDNSQLNNSVMLEKAKVSSTCDYIKSFSTRYRLSLPPLCQPSKI